ncbi:MAG: hypothetical protein WCF57_23305 [Pyrinomonadaceae bacterium]
MKKIAMLTFVLAALVVTPLIARADVEDRLFDFTDAYYLKNGVNPASIVNRVNGTPPRSVIDNPFFNFQRNVRMLRTNPAYNHSGAITYWSVMGDIFVAGFTNNAAGRKARQIADNMPLYVFPTRTGNPIGLGNNRQADIVDMRNGYFSNNPLGLWIHIWVSYTDRAFNTAEGRKALADLQKKNGLALDGTPIIRTLSELEGLFSKGLAAKRFRNPDGSEGPMYGICPVIKDPTDGGIAPDATLGVVLKPDGTPLEPAFVSNFNSLQNTGDWARR